MATATFGSPIQELEGETLTLGTSAGWKAVMPDYQEIKLYCAAAWRLALVPKLARVAYYDASAGTYTDYTKYATDRSSTHVPLDGMVVADYLYLGFTGEVLGAYFDVGSNVNSETATLDVEYCSTAQVMNSGTITTPVAFTDVGTDGDGTTSGGATLAQDGVYTWALPSFKKSAIDGLSGEELYWIRFKPSATLSDPLDINEIIPVYHDTNYAYMEAGNEYQFSLNLAKVGGIQALVASGTPTLNITWIKH